MEIVAKVYEYEIRRSEFMRELDKLGMIVDNFMICTLQKKALQVIIDRYLLLHEAIDENIEIDPEEYDSELFDMINEYDTEEEYSSMLLKNHLSERDVKNIINNKILIKKHIENFQNEPLQIPEAKMRKFYESNLELFQTQEEVSCQHILIRGLGEKNHARAIAVRRRIKSPADFQYVASKFSECPRSEKCDDLGYFHRGKLMKEIDDVAFHLAMNEISEPFPSPLGYHILMLVGRHEPKILPFEDIRDILETRLAHIDTELRLVKHMQELRDSGKEHIQIFEERLLAPFNCLFK
ncbi:MAG TPA: peptidylprolyl isomerase [Candidatus Cloacimonadota bacterium]|nr:peptidylprolyl isomerase [Candidatus Cloacimonadota bacterium]HPT73124.1 peptidylprolyl isomerase [Candidatus Cloacimonadota bacterium]